MADERTQETAEDAALRREREGLVLMRVMPGKAAMPYNDGTGSKLHQPGDVFEGAPKLLMDFPGWLQAIDEDGQPLSMEKLAAADPRMLQARAHERVTYLQEFKARREGQHQAEMADLDRRIADAEQEALADAQRRMDAKRRTGPQADSGAAGTTNPAVSGDQAAPQAGPSGRARNSRAAGSPEVVSE